MQLAIRGKEGLRRSYIDPWRLRAALILLAALCSLQATARRAAALPVYSRQFNVPCSTCHTVPPRLNKFGLAFQANHFNWPGPTQRPRVDGSRYLPVTTITTYVYEHDFLARQDTANIQTFELFFSSGLGISHGREGGYYIDLTAAATGDGVNGDLDDAYVSLPVAGRHGQLALTVGQVTPLLYQYDPVNSLTDTLPYGFTEGVNNFAFGTSTPTIRLDYFDRRGAVSADGNYLSLAIPFQGHLELTRNGAVGPGNGLFAHAFHRWGYLTLGAVGYVHKQSNMTGLIGTYALRDRIYFTGTAVLAHDTGVNTTHTAFEAEYLPNRRLALTGRVELIGGELSGGASVAAINYYPFSNQYLRLTAESRQRRDDRALDLTVRFQY
jgi:hypothetical protein